MTAPSEHRLDSESAATLWEAAGDAVDNATLSAVAFERRDAQPLIPVIVAGLALKALVGVFCGGVFVGLGVPKLGKRVGEEARELLLRLRKGEAADVDADGVTEKVEGLVAEARSRAVPEAVVVDAEQAVAALLIERGEDPETAEACARALARAVLASD
jgi:hypothetical protein